MSYDKYIQQARESIYTDGDTISSLEYFKKAFNVVKYPFFEHFQEYWQIQVFHKESSPYVGNCEYFFKNKRERDFFYSKNVFLSESQLSIIKDSNFRLLIDDLYERDQAIDRLSPNKRKLFEEIIEEFKGLIEKFGFPTEENIGLYIDSDGKLESSPSTILVIHGIQLSDDYFLKNLDLFYQNGLIQGSDYRMIKNLIGR